MKNFLIIFSCFFISYSVEAQNFGLKVGNTASWMNSPYETNDYFNTNTFLGGAFIQVGDGNIFLRNEINYLQKGNLEKLLGADIKQTLSYFETNALSYFHITRAHSYFKYILEVATPPWIVFEVDVVNYI